MHCLLRPISDNVLVKYVEPCGSQTQRGQGGRESTLLNALSSAARFGLDEEEALAIAKHVLRVIKDQWEQRFRDVGVPAREIDTLRGTSVLSPVAIDLRTRPK